MKASYAKETDGVVNFLIGYQRNGDFPQQEEQIADLVNVFCHLGYENAVQSL